MDYIKLEVWIESRKLTNFIYVITKKIPKEEMFALTNQLRRSAVSVPSNIAEGIGRQTKKLLLISFIFREGHFMNLKHNVL